MPYIGNKTADTTLVEDNSITSAKIVDSAVITAKVNNDAVTKDKVDFVTDSGGASLEAKGSSGYDGAVRLNCSVNSHYTELKSASHGSYSGNLSFTLPSSTGTNGQFLQTNGSGVLSFANAGGIFESQLLHVREEAANNTSGGTFNSGSWVKRTLDTTKTNEITGASLSSSQITLPAGTYFIFGMANVGSDVGRHTAKLYNTTDSSDTIIGSSEYSDGLGHSGKSIVTGRFTISGQKTFELQHRCSSTSNVDGFGANANFSVVQVFAEVQIWKTA